MRIGFFRKAVGLALYHMFAKHLPANYAPLGFMFQWARYLCARLILTNCGKQLYIQPGARFSHRIRIGDYSQIGEGCRINGDVTIGRYVLMAPGVHILSQSHIYSDPTVPISLQGVTHAETVIGDDVWLCTNVIVLPGVKIGDHAIIAAGSVVTRNIPEGAIAGGIPARIIRMRDGWQRPSISGI